MPVEQHYDRDFVQIPNMHLHLEAFNPHAPRLCAAHLLFSDQAVANVRTARHLLLVRDPYDWVLARARFFVSVDAVARERAATFARRAMSRTPASADDDSWAEEKVSLVGKVIPTT